MTKQQFYYRVPSYLVGCALVLLAWEPALWLVGKWQDAAYDSAGFWACLFTLGFIAWSVSSPIISQQPINKKLVLGLLLMTAVTRLAGQWLAINTLGALALVIDIYAIALLLKLQQRQRPLNPFWLSILFAFSLPLERVIQRLGGYALQELSTSTSCHLLGLFSNHITCSGTRIQIPNHTFLIDLPCAGVNNLVLLFVITSALMVIARPTWRQSFWVLLLIPVLAFLVNLIRILLLIAGTSSESLKNYGIDVMAQPWHDLTGLIALIPAGFVLYYLFFTLYHPVKPNKVFQEQMRWIVPKSIQQDAWWWNLKAQRQQQKIRVLASILFLMLTVAIVSTPKNPIDKQTHVQLPHLPLHLGNHYQQAIPLLAKEQRYFTQYGGQAQKAVYGDYRLMLTSTRSPLRHLHAPDECLRGLGFQVTYLGSFDHPIPTALYKAVDPEGNVWKVASSFIHQNQVTTSVSAAVWQWLQQPQSEWLTLQRIAPWHSDLITDRQWDTQLLHALDLNHLIGGSYAHR